MLRKFGKLRQDYKIAIKDASRKNFEICEFHDECDFCKKPELGSFAYGCSYDECDGYMCGKCILKTRNKHHTKPIRNRVY